MELYSLILGVFAGICFGTGVIYLFTGLRRSGGNRLHLSFALFALAYAGATAAWALAYHTFFLEAYLRVARWGGLLTVLALITLMWFVANYTQVRPRAFLWGLTAVFGIVVIVSFVRPNFIHTDIFGISTVNLPWGETVALLDANESIWEIIFFLSQYILIGFLIYACVRQYRRGERQAALMLGVGLLFLMFALVFDILLIDSGALNFVYLGDFGFLPLLIVMSFQLANEVIKTEEELAEHRHNLEVRVGERTAELQNTNNNLEREIDERQKVASALRRSERTARALLNAPSDTAMLVEPDGEILDTNLVGASRLGLSVAEALGKNAFDLMGPDVSALRKAKAEELIATRQPVRWEDEHGGRYYDNNLYPIMDDSGEVASIAVFATDITDYVRAQQQEKEAAAIQERNRLARDLHDAVTQTVYSASLIAEALPQVWKRNPDEGMRNLFKLRQLVRGALGEMRTLLFELRPSALQAAELNTLLRQLADVLTGRTRIPVELILEGDTQPPSEVKIVLYRITQEAFNNITKHSNATQVQVTLQSDLEQLTLAIRDNGIGFDPQAVTAESMGLRIMRERAESVDVLVEVQSASGNGTQVTVIWTGGSPAAQDASAPPLSE